MPAECRVCPNNCVIPDGGRGICGVRGAENRTLHLPYHGAISAAAMDPVEKKPLYHYKPASSVFSIGFYGCSLSCPFCQNHHISKSFPQPAKLNFSSPTDIVEAAESNGAESIAYTYSEPLIHYEWLLECTAAARAAGLRNIIVTNGYLNPDRFDDLLENTDALNIDLKSFNPDFYRRELKGRLQPVLDFITVSARTAHVELTTLIIPGKNDSEEEIRAAADFISSTDVNIPWHLSAYYPTFKYSLPPTSPDKLIRLAETASEKLNFVYTGNITGGISDTICPDCGQLLISRSGYSTDICGIENGVCSGCSAPITGFGIVI